MSDTFFQGPKKILGGLHPSGYGPECKCWRIYAMVDLYLRFKLRVKGGDNEIKICI